MSGNSRIGQLKVGGRSGVETERHQDGVDGDAVANVMTSTQTLALESERGVEGYRGLVPGEHMELQLANADNPGPRDGLLEQSTANTPTAVGRRDHQPQIGDMTARRMNVASHRQPTHDAAVMGCHVDRSVRVPTHRSQVAPLLRHGPGHLGGQQPVTLLEADLTREVDERLSVGRFGAPNLGHGTTTP